MSNYNETVKKDLMSLYEELYNIGQNKGASSIFNTGLLKKLKYEPEEVKKILGLSDNNNSEKKQSKISLEISSIRDKDQALEYFQKNLADVFQPDISEMEKNSILKKVTLEELKYLYEKIYDIPLGNNCKKMDVIFKIKDFWDSQKRTKDLIKNLY